MRKDKGLNGDLDRLPMLTWIMFLKFLDDLEIQREEERKLANPSPARTSSGLRPPSPQRGEGRFKPAIEPPYRWRDWAAQSDGITGDELLSFINSEECALPHGPTEKPKRGPALFRYLRLLASSASAGVADTRRDVIATVFRGVQNRMVSGYLLRDVINKLNGIHFTAATSCTRWARSRNPCCARCVMQPAIPASFTPREPSCGSWSRSRIRTSAKRSWTPQMEPADSSWKPPIICCNT
jgi:type I restriction enzyme M protein